MKSRNKIHFINELDFESRNAGYKARFDICNIMRSNDKVNVVDIPLWGSAIERIAKLPRLIYYFLFTFKFGDLILLQYPFPKPFINIVIAISKIKGIDLGFIIHDVDILRGESFNEDIKNLNLSKVNITHNKKMSEKLMKMGVRTKAIEINIFDYLLISDVVANEVSEDAIIFCGNLNIEKSGFIYDWISHGFVRKVYGVNQSDNISINNQYEGAFNPNSPPQITPSLGAKVFGLVWDGPSMNECKGSYGEYLKFNNPHKTSLYIAMGLPIIIWKKSAIHNYLSDNNVAIGINDLSELNDVFSNLSDDDYNKMIESVSLLKCKIISGENTNVAINSLFKAMGR